MDNLYLGRITSPLMRLLILTLVIMMMTSTTHADSKIVYPPTRTDDVVETLHGVAVADPYRWLEDDNAAETKAWVEAQNKVTNAYLATIPQRDAIHRRMTQLWNYERYGIPFKRAARYFYTRNNGLQNQAVLYTAPALDAAPSVLLDPNTLSPDGTIALTGLDISEDGARLAYGLAVAGSDWQEIRVRDVATAKDLADHIQWVKFSGISWAKDGKGFFYSRYDAPSEAEKLTKTNYFHKLYYHAVGTPQSADMLIYHRPDQKDWSFHGHVTDDGKYLIIHSSQGSSPKNRILYKSLERADAPVVELLMENDAEYNFIDNDGGVFWFKTDKNAPLGRLIAIDIAHPEPQAWKEIIAESKDTLSGIDAVGERFFAKYLHDAHSVVRGFSLDGKPLEEIPLPAIGSAGGFGGKRSDAETFYSFTSYTTPGSIYRLDIKSNQTTLFKQPKVAFNPDDYETKQVFYNSKDGTRIPMFITSKKGLNLDGNNPTQLYGYGGFAISLTPGFSPATLAWMELGGIYAVPNLRGGNEYGEAWHLAGTKLKKQNVFDDFIAAAQYLIDNKYTSREKLAISGGSNGGLLVGAAMTQRPDLFAAALPAVGVMDMLRFHKFTIGWAWSTDYGTADDPAEFKALYAYSPYHNLKPGTDYPATLVTTADHDDRVVPAHSFKFAARLQACQTGDKPTLIRIETKAGHGAGKPTTKQIDYQADILAFLVKELNMNDPNAPRE
jgi:prolyl oligopeptidase